MASLLQKIAGFAGVVGAVHKEVTANYVRGFNSTPIPNNSVRVRFSASVITVPVEEGDLLSEVIARAAELAHVELNLGQAVLLKIENGLSTPVSFDQAPELGGLYRVQQNVGTAG